MKVFLINPDCSEGEGQNLRVGIFPGRLIKLNPMPGNIRIGLPWFTGPFQKPLVHKTGMALAESNHLPNKTEHIAVSARKTPVKPGYLVVLTIGVVVTFLRHQHLIPVKEHGDSLTQKQNGHEVPGLPLPQRGDPFIIGLSFYPTVPAKVVIRSILIVITVGVIVFLVIAYEIVDSEAIVTCNEIDTVTGQSLFTPIEVTAPHQSRGNLPNNPFFAPDKTTDYITVHAIPFSPAVPWISYYLVKPCSIPRFCNDFRVCQGLRKFNEPRSRGKAFRDSVHVAGKDTCQVETKPINVHLPYPILQTIDNEAGDYRVVAVDCVATACKVPVQPPVMGVKMIKT